MQTTTASLPRSLAGAALAALIAAAGGGGSASAVASGEYGVPECDRYVQKYLACIDSKVPAEMRAMMRQPFDQSRAEWKRAAATAVRLPEVKGDT